MHKYPANFPDREPLNAPGGRLARARYAADSHVLLHGNETTDAPEAAIRLRVAHVKEAVDPLRSFYSQMETPELLALDGPKGPIRCVNFRQAIVNHMHGKSAAQIPKHSDPFDGLAPRP
jgi:hypothetical protein